MSTPVLSSPLAILALACAQACAQTPAASAPAANVATPSWLLTGDAKRVDPPEGADARAVWVQLTPDANDQLGMALLQGVNIYPQGGLTISFAYSTWGAGPTAGDGLSVFLFDAAKGMARAQPGGGLGYCKGLGGWLALGLDEYGNFSHPQDRCGNGPGPQPRSVVLRGPASDGNPFIAAGSLPQITQRDAPTGERSGFAEIALHLWPHAPGYTIAVDWRPPGGAWWPVIDRAEFPFAPPGALTLGVAASTGAAKNAHEVGVVRAAAHTGTAATLRFDPPESADRKSSLVFEIGAGTRRASTFVRSFTFELPAGLEIANPPGFGGTCESSMHATPGTRAVMIDAGSKVRPGGCTVSVKVIARGPGWFVSTLPAGTMLTDIGVNVAPASATLAVSR